MESINLQNIPKLLQDCENVSDVQMSTNYLNYEEGITGNCASIFSISNFELLLRNPDNLKIESAHFHIEKLKNLPFCMILYHTVGSPYLSLDLRLFHVLEKCKGSYTLWLIDKNQEKIKFFYGAIHSEKGCFPVFTTKNFLQINKFKNPYCTWLTNDTLNILITIEITYEKPLLSFVISFPTKVELNKALDEMKNSIS